MPKYIHHPRPASVRQQVGPGGPLTERTEQVFIFALTSRQLGRQETSPNAKAD